MLAAKRLIYNPVLLYAQEVNEFKFCIEYT